MLAIEKKKSPHKCVGKLRINHWSKHIYCRKQRKNPVFPVVITTKTKTISTERIAMLKGGENGETNLPVGWSVGETGGFSGM